MEKVKIETYKKIDIFYNKGNGKLLFNFEDRDMEVKYLFEAKEIIDEPRWEDCDLQGYYIDETFNDVVGLAKAEKKDIKSGEPLWLFKGKYDTEYKQEKRWSNDNKVYLKNETNDNIYQEFLDQQDIVNSETRKMKNIIYKYANK